jgi:hypothetical protein
LIEETEAGQTPFEIVQLRTLLPGLNIFTEAFGAETSSIFSELPFTDHIPLPTAGIFPASTVEPAVSHNRISCPATACVGSVSRVIFKVETEEAQTPLVMVQLNTLVPYPSPLIVVEAEIAEEIIPEPLTNAHVPVPTAGRFALTVVIGDDSQTCWLLPANETLGNTSMKTETESLEAGQTPFDTDHTRMFSPGLKEEYVAAASKGLLSTPAPVATFQLPTPIAGIFPLRKTAGSEIHIA